MLCKTLILFPQSSIRREALLYVFEDNEAVIEVRHVSRTHRVLLIGCSGEILILRSYIDTKNQLADILTKGNLTCDEWKFVDLV